MSKISKTLKKDLLTYLNFNLDMRNPAIKDYIKNKNGIEILQNQLMTIPEYKKRYANRINQQKFQTKKKQEIKKKQQEEKKKKEAIIKIQKLYKKKQEEKKRQQEEQEINKKIDNLIYKYRQFEYPKINNLIYPNTEYNFNINDFFNWIKNEDYNILYYISTNEQIMKIELRNKLFNKILDAVQEVINFSPFKNSNHTVIEINNVFYTLHNKTIDTIRENLKGRSQALMMSSDIIEHIYSLININASIKFKTFANTHKNNNVVGAFFPYYNRTKLNLERYQITNGENGDPETNINNDNCLIYALRLLKIEEEKIIIIKKYVCNGKIPMCKLKNICEDVGIRINLITEKNDKGENKNKKVLYGKEGRIYNICCVVEHYFIFDDETPYTKYYIDNYERLKDVKDGNYIYNNMNQKKKNRVINSFNLIMALLENKEQLLNKIDYANINLYDEPYKGYIIDEDESNFKDLYFDPKYNAKLYEEEEPKEPKAKTPIIIFDFETYTENNIHIPYLCCSIDENNNKRRFIGEDCGEQLLKSLKSDVILMAHNAKYDMRFIIKNLSKCNEINNGSSFITFSGYYKNFKITIKDSYKLIASKASEMPNMFLSSDECKKIKKEVMPYGVYNRQNLIKKYIELDECLKYLKTDEEKEEFITNCKNWQLLNNNMVDILEYSIIYCNMDCEILKKCYSVFREWCLNDFKLDIDEILTIPSLAERYFKNCGCFEGCYKLSGLPQLFISRSVVGGRTMMRNNEKSIIENMVLNDFDAVSLYPSAMARINGFLKGLPKVIKTSNLNYESIKNYDGYFIQIKIKKVGIKRSFSLMSYKTDKGIRDFNNDMIDKIMIVDKTTTEDLINFQNVEFEILRGYYFDEGFNNKIVETIKYLFSKRVELKKKTKEHPEGNKSEVIYKLIMNAGYGKLITKPHDTKIKFFDDEKTFNIYLSRNYNIVNNYIEYTKGKFRIEINEMKGNQYNYCHLGSEILSMSKRIMNEVICTAEDNNLNIYYQDTDSIHINDEDIKKLSEIYENKYNKVLIGKGMGQFHSDFKMEVKDKQIKNIVSTGLIMLGKKSYIDKLRGEDENGNFHYDYHIRLKGINEEAIKQKIKDNYNNNPYELYKDLYKGEKIIFDLTANGYKCCFEFNKSYGVSTKTSFSREVCF